MVVGMLSDLCVLKLVLHFIFTVSAVNADVLWLKINRSVSRKHQQLLMGIIDFVKQIGRILLNWNVLKSVCSGEGYIGGMRVE